MSAYFKRGWQSGLELLNIWWRSVTEYANGGGDTGWLPADFHRQNRQLVEFVRTVAKVDPTPFYEIGSLIERREGIIGSRGDGADWIVVQHSDPTAKPDDIINAIFRATLAKDALWQRGLTNKKAGRPKLPTTLAAEKLIAEGSNTDQITERVDISAGNARQVRSRTRRKT